MKSSFDINMLLAPFLSKTQLTLGNDTGNSNDSFFHALATLLNETGSKPKNSNFSQHSTESLRADCLSYITAADAGNWAIAEIEINISKAGYNYQSLDEYKKKITASPDKSNDFISGSYTLEGRIICGLYKKCLHIAQPNASVFDAQGKLVCPASVSHFLISSAIIMLLTDENAVPNVPNLINMVMTTEKFIPALPTKRSLDKNNDITENNKKLKIDTSQPNQTTITANKNEALLLSSLSIKESETLENFMKTKIRIIKGLKSFFQVHFETIDLALSFSEWLKPLSCLKDLNIHKAEVSEETYESKPVYIVRLSAEQMTELGLTATDENKNIEKNKTIARHSETRTFDATKQATVLDMISPCVSGQRVIAQTDNVANIREHLLKMSDEAFIEFAKKADGTMLDVTLASQPEECDEFLINLFRFKSSKGLLLFVNKTSSYLFNPFILKPIAPSNPRKFSFWLRKLCITNVNLLMLAAGMKQNALYMELINRITEKELNSLSETLLENILKFTVKDLDTPAVLAFINLISQDLISKISINCVSNEMHPLYLLIQRGTDTSVRAFIKKMTQGSLKTSLEIPIINPSEFNGVAHFSILAAALRYSNHETIKMIIKEKGLQKETITCALTMFSDQPGSPTHNTGTLKTRQLIEIACLYQKAETILMLIDYIDHQKSTPPLLAKRIVDTYFKQSNSSANDTRTNEEIKQIFFLGEFIQKHCTHFIDKINQGYSFLNHETESFVIENMRIHCKNILKKEKYSLPRNEIMLFHSLRNVLPKKYTDEIFALLADHLQVHGTSWYTKPLKHINYLSFFEIKPSPHIPEFSSDDPIVERFQKLTKENRILMKVIPQNKTRHDHFVAQLVDFSFRPKDLRKPPDGEVKYKAIHLTGDIVPYENHDDNHPKKQEKMKKGYTHTKKLSLTLFSDHLNTPPFSHHHTNNTSVGYLFDRNKCVIKGMFRYDGGTIKHRWHAPSINDASNSLHHYPDYNFTDFEKFSHIVNETCGRTNEVLAKVNKDALLAIVICARHKETIDTALERHTEIKTRFNIDLPIIHYDFTQGCLALYVNPDNNSKPAMPSLS